jgi:hypothetical protein
MEQDKQPQTNFPAAHVEPPIPVQQAAKGKKTVTMVFKRPVRLTTREGVIDFPEGVVEVPEDLADHDYLRLSGATRHEQKGWMASVKKGQNDAPVFTQRHIDVLKSVGVPNINTPADAEKYYNGLPDDHKKEFLEYVSTWQPNDQYHLQRRVQDAASGARKAAPPSSKGGEPGPDPSTVHELIQEGSVLGRESIPDVDSVKMTEEHRQFFEARGYPSKTVEDAQKRYDNFSASDKVGFLHTFDERGKEPADERGKEPGTTKTVTQPASSKTEKK